MKWLIPEGWRWPRIVTHVLDSESKTATLGYMILITASVGLFKGRVVDGDSWLICVTISSALIGGKLVGETVLAMRTGRASPVKEDKSDVPAPPAPGAA